MFQRLIIILIFIFPFSNLPASQPIGWHKVLIPNPESASGMVVVQINGKAGVGTISREATLYLAGIPRSGRFTMGIYLGNLDKEWAGIPWDDFRGPDLSENAIRSNPVEVVVTLSNRQIAAKYRMLVSGALLPKDHVGRNAECVVISSNERNYDGISLRKLYEAMVTGYKEIGINIQFPGTNQKIKIEINSDIGCQALSEFLISNKK